MQISADPAEHPRRLDVELLRVIAAVMVISIHATSQVITIGERTGPGLAYWVALVANDAARCGVPVFFALTGWLLLRRPVPDGTGWLTSRVVRLLVPLVTWSLIYVAEEVIRGAITGRPAWTSAAGAGAWALERTGDLLAGPGTRTHLWYLYFALAITLVVWLVQATRFPHRDHRVITLAALMLILPSGVAAAFGTRVSWESILWALGYTALGYRLLEVPPRRAIAAGVYGMGVVGLVVLTALVGYDRWPSAYSSPLVVACTIGVIGLVIGRRIPAAWSRPLVATGSLTLGVYLVHPLALDVIRVAVTPGGPLAWLSPVPRLALLWVFGVGASFAVAWAWHRSGRLTRLLG